ncbi:hypothetical protein [Clostridium oryzae]|uniref:Uncharacterized protein n=1 Tax=Clostridium oryzae TaxID=1450648 RepID=A0A1V4I8C3_9CLOT|nr:hypothetical protein [Clostridium oryzae]OPJ56159.1 hypothetical protein CLORY_43080 [Clostridium oryzae]
MLNQIIPIISAAGVSIAIVMIKGVGDASINKEIESKIGAYNYDFIKTVGLDVWNIVEEKFRLKEAVGKFTDEKIAEFNKLIKERISSISDEDIEKVRQAIVGEANKGKKELSEDITALHANVTKLTNDDASLVAENTSLKQTIYNIQNSVQTVSTTTQSTPGV